MIKSKLKNNYKFNPFSGVLDDDISLVISPIFNLGNLKAKILHSAPILIQFVGKQGRGKTTHLKYLHQHLGHFPIFYLNKDSDFEDLINHSSPVIFVDSIHHMNVFHRQTLFKTDKTIIFTTHWTKKLECMAVNRRLHSISFKGIDENKLQIILNKRLALASHNTLDKTEIFTLVESKLLIQKFGDNYRGIINYLFEQYQ